MRCIPPITVTEDFIIGILIGPTRIKIGASSMVVPVNQPPKAK